MRGTWRLPCVLVATLSIGGCGQPDQPRPHPEVTRAVYRVQITYEIHGNPINDRFPAKLVLPMAGSATAISADGELLTARHVVNIIDALRSLCVGVILDYEHGTGLNLASIKSVQLTVQATDGRQWHGTATPEPGAACDASGRPRLVWDESSRAKVVAIDGEVDLALIRIWASDIPYLKLDRTAPAPGAVLVAAGISASGMTVREGTVVEPCIVYPDALLTRPGIPLLRMSQYIRPGMSGGPVTSKGRLVGINVMIQTIPPWDSFAVSATYAAAWYDWVHGITPQPPPVQCR